MQLFEEIGFAVIFVVGLLPFRPRSAELSKAHSSTNGTSSSQSGQGSLFALHYFLFSFYFLSSLHSLFPDASTLVHYKHTSLSYTFNIVI